MIPTNDLEEKIPLWNIKNITIFFVYKYMIFNREKAFYCMHKKHLLSAFGRCIEHSGMPVVIGKNGHLFPQKIMDTNQQWLIAFDERVNTE